MSEDLDRLWKFQLGDIVRLVIFAKQQGNPGDPWSSRYTEPRGMIVGQLLERCSGGIQRAYNVRWASSDGTVGTRLVRHFEEELVASEPFGTVEGKGGGKKDEHRA